MNVKNALWCVSKSKNVYSYLWSFYNLALCVSFFLYNRMSGQWQRSQKYASVGHYELKILVTPNLTRPTDSWLDAFWQKDSSLRLAACYITRNKWEFFSFWSSVLFTHLLWILNKVDNAIMFTLFFNYWTEHPLCVRIWVSWMNYIKSNSWFDSSNKKNAVGACAP